MEGLSQYNLGFNGQGSVDENYIAADNKLGENKEFYKVLGWRQSWT